MPDLAPGRFDDEIFMASVAARELLDGEVCFVGIGSPSVAAVLAKRRHAPSMTLVYESGAIGALPDVLPLSTGSPCISQPSPYLGDCTDVFGAMQAGRMEVGMLSAAQVDRRGNLNSTVIGGTYLEPKLRLVGSGGAHDIASLISRLIIVMPHDPRRFVEHVDFITAPGLGDDGHRPDGTQGVGPVAVITSRATFDLTIGELRLVGVRDGLSADDAVEGIPWEVPRADRIVVLHEPSAEDHAFLFDLLLRSELSG